MTAPFAVVASRLLVAAVCLATWGYGVTTYIPFAVAQFVRPQLFPQLSAFVIWHHLWWGSAFVLSAATLIPGLVRGPRDRAEWWAAAGYVVVLGAFSAYLTGAPFLASLSGSRSMAVVPGALLPVVWLAVIDHLSSRDAFRSNDRRRATGQRHVLAACLTTAGLLWLLHGARAWLMVGVTAGLLPLVMREAWSLVLHLATFAGAYAVLSLISAIAGARANPFAWEYGLTLVLLAGAAAEFLRRLVLPAFSFSQAEAGLIAVPFGLTLALLWSSLRIRRVAGAAAGEGALAVLLPSAGPRRMLGGLWVTVIAVLAALALGAVVRIDWAFILQSLMAAVEALLVFAIVRGWSPYQTDQSWSLPRLLAPALIALVALQVLPHAAVRLMAASGDARVATPAVIDQLHAVNALAAAAADRLVEQPVFDPSFYREVLSTETRQSAHDPAPPTDAIAGPFVPLRARPPHLFVFVIDSLRRDYLSAYNPAVTFTPAIDAWARDHFVFRNAFTPYGGTWLAMPTIWTGSPVTRGWASIFQRVNALDAMVTAANYDVVINDHTVAKDLAPNPNRVFLNPYVSSVQTDLCQNLASLEPHLAGRASASRPLFVYLAPMNVHILNTGMGAGVRSEKYAGFHAPYATRLERLDGCFGAFVARLKELGLYDDSIIILTSDHGDSLGAEGRWGHQFFLFPESIRIPLIVQLPRQQQPAYTTDLGRVALLTDLAPTLLALLGQPVRDLGLPYGSPLFVPADRDLRPRRRDSVLLMSSYGSTYAVLRRNGRFLYISDLLNWREYAYTLVREPLGESVAVSNPLRRLNQVLIRKHVQEVDEIYRRK